MPELNLPDFIGREVTLVSLPDGYTSKDSQVKLGEKYIVKDIGGSCFVIVLPDGSTEFLHYGIFKETWQT